MAKVGDVLVQLEARSAKFDQQLKKSAAQIKHLEKRSQSLAGTMGKLAKVAKGFLPVIGVAAFTAQLRKSIQAADDLAKAADRVGLGVESFQVLQLAAETSGVSLRQLETGMQRFARRAGEISTFNQSELKKSFEALGISARDAGGKLKGTEELLYEFAAGLSEVESEQQRLALITKAFDTEGAKFGAFLKDGIEGLEAYREQAERLNLIMSEDTVRAMEDLQTDLDLLGRGWDVMWGKAIGGALRFMGLSRLGAIEEVTREINTLQRQLDQSGLFDKLLGGKFDASGQFVGNDEQIRDTLKSKKADLDALIASYAGARNAARGGGGGVEIAPPGSAASAVPSYLMRPDGGGQFSLDTIMDRQWEAYERDLERRRRYTADSENLYKKLGRTVDATNMAMEDSAQVAFGGMEQAIGDLVLTGKVDFKSLALSAAQSLTQIISKMLVLKLVSATPLGDLFASGAVFSGGSVQKYASGGIVSGPTLFPMANGGIGLMGEKTPEAVMPLSRDRRGRLGVLVAGGAGGSPSITINVANSAPSTPQNDQRLARTAAREMQRAMREASRSFMLDEQRPGGLLNRF